MAGPTRASAFQRLVRVAYGGLMWLLQPALRVRVWRRGRSEPGYLEAVAERFGHYGPVPDAGGQPVVWVHAVSLGETRAAGVLVQALRAQWPGMRLVLTHGTATGRQAGRALLQPGDVQRWLPWDTPAAVRRFLAHHRPAIGLLMETEVWPQLVAGCQQQRVPLVLANGRLSERSLRAARRLGPLLGPAYRGLTQVLAQTEADARRYRALGVEHVQVLGNLKYDQIPDDQQLVLGRQWGRLWRQRSQRPIAVLASSREGEEAAFLAALDQHAAALSQVPPLQWMVVPRHPQRFDAVEALIRASGRRVLRLSALREEGLLAPTEPDGTIWLGDTMGEMPFYYGLSDVALLGGSFEPLGGQNLIEAAACGCPVIMGPHTFNFAEAAELAEAAGAALRVSDLSAAVLAADGMTRQTTQLRRTHRAAEAHVAAMRGVAARSARACAAVLALSLRAKPAR